MNDDDLDLVESEDENSDNFDNQQVANQYRENHNYHILEPLSRNLATLKGAVSLDQRASGLKL